MNSNEFLKPTDCGIDLYFIGREKPFEADGSQCKHVFNMSAVIGADIDAGVFYKHSVDYLKRYGLLLSPGEVGCTMAHIQTYEKINCRDRPGLIFECDIEPRMNDLQTALKLSLDSGRDFIHFGFQSDIPDGKKLFGEYVEEFSLFRANRFLNFYGSFSYFVTPVGAEYLRNKHKEQLHKADDWKFLLCGKGPGSWHFPIFPHPVERGSLHTERQMARVTKSSRAFWRKLNPVDLSEKIINLVRRMYISSRYKIIEPGLLEKRHGAK
jgi:hypothetical protein